jgi:hypothetical protein
MATVEEMLTEIGLSEAWLRRVLGTVEAYINRLVVLGIPRDEAERQSFRGDLRNILEMMRFQHFSARRAARTLSRAPEELSDSLDEEQAEEVAEEDEEEENEDNEEEEENEE